MRILLAITLALIVGFTIGAVRDALATPPPAKDSTEARLQALEYLRWQEGHAINVVSTKVWERVALCPCYTTDPVLMPFNTTPNVNGSYKHLIARSASSHGAWYAENNGDGDSWHVWVVVTISDKEYGPFSWDVWESNGFVQGRY